MKNQKGISLITLIILIAVIIGVIIFIIANNQGSGTVKIKWGYMPSPEYYELSVAALNSELYGSGVGTLSKASFNTLGKDIKKAKGKWFKDSSVNFRAKSEKIGNFEVITLTDGEHTATFKFDNVSDGVEYTFKKENGTGYRITIK